MATISFRIAKDASVNLEVSGTTGANCEQITRAFEDALGTKVDSQQKPEYFVQLDGIEQQAEVHEG